MLLLVDLMAIGRERLNSWDIAAGIVIVKESGGIICSLEKDMNPLLNGSILAASDKIYEEFSSLILT